MKGTMNMETIIAIAIMAVFGTAATCAAYCIVNNVFGKEAKQ